ncbi:MAG: hypothetical protein HRU34_17875 [Richelia sp.]|nr:hypothetical protein [Richelia sp.]CDN13781.1 hypothetical protein RintRC_1120 [Richelia intracellularis]
MSQSKLNRRFTQGFGIFLGVAIAVYVLRGLAILTFIPGGVIGLLFLLALFFGLLSYAQTSWWRF